MYESCRHYLKLKKLILKIKATKVLNLLRRHMHTCCASSKQKAFRALVIPVLDYASTVWNPQTNKTLLPLNEFKTVVLTGFVGADFVLVPIDGLDHLKNVVQSYFGHYSLLEESICL